MRTYLFFIAFLLSLNNIFAQDTLAYEVQRQRVNDLLTKRSERFGKFNESLQARTGIFGLKTKKDMQASIDILREIVATDNHIFRETKILLEYKDMEKTFISHQAEANLSRINGYVNTISKLQKSQEEQASLVAELERQVSLYLTISVFSFIIILVLITMYLKLKLLNRKTLNH